MEDCIFCVAFWYGILGVEYSQFSRIFKWVLHKAKEKQNTTKGLKGQIITTICQTNIKMLFDFETMPLFLSKPGPVVQANEGFSFKGISVPCQ